MLPTTSTVLRAIRCFLPHHEARFRQLPGGNINLTWLVTSDATPAIILQRLHPRVFADPQRTCRNILTINHAYQRWQRRHDQTAKHWRIPCLLATTDGRHWWEDDEGHLWRAMDAVPASRTCHHCADREMATTIGEGLALFHQITADIDPAHLPPTIPDFHNTPVYLAKLKKKLTSISRPLTADIEEMARFIQRREEKAGLIAQAREKGQLCATTTHGDPKLANFLFAEKENRAISLIDLDTVGPGLRILDIGDCLRSCAITETPSPSFHLTTCRHIIHGYCQQQHLSVAEWHYLARAIWLLPFELGVRFLTDYLDGNRYFTIQHPGHNLERARRQFSLVSSIEDQYPLLKALVAEIRQ